MKWVTTSRTHVVVPKKYVIFFYNSHWFKLIDTNYRFSPVGGCHRLAGRRGIRKCWATMRPICRWNRFYGVHTSHFHQGVRSNQPAKQNIFCLILYVHEVLSNDMLPK